MTYRVSTVVKILGCNTYNLDHGQPLWLSMSVSMVDSRMPQNNILIFF